MGVCEYGVWEYVSMGVWEYGCVGVCQYGCMGVWEYGVLCFSGSRDYGGGGETNQSVPGGIIS